MNIVYDNVAFYIQKSGGVSVVFNELIKRALSIFGNDCSFIQYGASQNHYLSTLNIKADMVMSKSNVLFSIKRLLPISVRYDSPFIFHSTYFTYTNNSNAIIINTVHDFTESKLKQSLSTRFRTWLQLRAIMHSDVVVCISESTKNDLLQLLPTFDSSKIRVIYNGVSNIYHVLSNPSFDLPFKKSSYILYVGSRSRYKNFQLVLDAVSETNLNLVMVGHNLTIFEKQNIELKLSKTRYKCMGFVSEEKLNVLYNNAFCLAYPSLYEGFGLPVIEAQRAGCPVIALNSTSIPEIIGDVSLLMQKSTKEEFLSKLSLLNEPIFRQTVISSGLENSKRFSWDIMANQYFDLYQECMSKK